MTFSDYLNQVICADSQSFLLKDELREQIDLIVTSPPYDKIRDYKGFELDLEAIGHGVNWCLKDGGVAVIVMQDQTKDFHKTLTTFEMTLKWDRQIGLRLFECCIYSRQGRPGAWWNKRFRVDHEFILIFFKGSRPRFFNKEHLKRSTTPYVKDFTTRQTNGSLAKRTFNSKHRMTQRSQGTIFHYLNTASEPRVNRSEKLKHPATFPRQLATDFIRTFSKKEEIVLDPFLGSGTTAIASLETNRQFIGIDISKEYCKLAANRIKKTINRIQEEKRRKLW